MENEKIIVYLGGGAMSGVYGAGVLKGMHDLSLVQNIEAIYGSSVGSLNAAYLLSKETEVGPTIYWKNLQENFIHPFNLVVGTAFLLWNRVAGPLDPTKAPNVVDINYIDKLITNDVPIKLDEIKRSPIELFVKVLNVDTGEIEYKRFKDYPTTDLFKAAVTIKPYFFEETILDGKRYVDAGIKEPLGIDYLIAKYPRRKILVILNEPIKRGFRHFLKNFVEGVVSGIYPYKISLFRLFLFREDSIKNDIKKCLTARNVLLLYPNFSGRVRPRTTRPEKLKDTFNVGYGDASKVKGFILKSL